MTKLSPVVLFVYNRPEHTRLTVEALLRNELASESDLYVFSDAAKQPSDEQSVQVVRNYIRNIKGFRNIHIVERTANLGLANSIISGVTVIINMRDRVIVLEDDMITSPYFLQFMNDALDIYEEEEKVVSIHGYLYPLKTIQPETFFIKGADCWGWATWKRGWDLIEMDGEKLFKMIVEQKKQYEFNMDGSYNFVNMLKDQIAGRNNSWAIRWYASAFLKDKLTLYPGISLLKNIGFDSSGVHCGASNVYDVEIADRRICVRKIELIENRAVRRCFASFNKRKLKIPFHKRLIRKMRKEAGKFIKLHSPPLVVDFIRL